MLPDFGSLSMGRAIDGALGISRAAGIRGANTPLWPEATFCGRVASSSSQTLRCRDRLAEDERVDVVCALVGDDGLAAAVRTHAHRTHHRIFDGMVLVDVEESVLGSFGFAVAPYRMSGLAPVKSARIRSSRPAPSSTCLPTVSPVSGKVKSTL